MKENRVINTVIFDMDGVIVDSMPYHYKAWRESMAPYGVEISKHEIYLREGENWKKTAKDFIERGETEKQPDNLKEIFNRREKIFKSFSREICLFKGVKEKLSDLKKKYKLGLVTATPSNHVKNLLPQEVYSNFDKVVAGEQVENGKPHPEPYLTCIKKFSILPSECVVIENAPLGIKSAKRAGVKKVIALTTSLPKEYLEEADIKIENINELNRILKNIGG